MIDRACRIKNRYGSASLCAKPKSTKKKKKKSWSLEIFNLVGGLLPPIQSIQKTLPIPEMLEHATT